MMLLGVPEHTSAHAELALLQLQYVVIDAPLTSAPESLIIGKLIETHGNITQSGIHLHHGIATGEGEYLGMWPAEACQGEGIVLDATRHTQTLIIGMDYQAGGGYIVLISPGLDITETGKAFSIQRQNGLTLLYLGSKVFVCTLGNTRATLLGGIAYGLQNLVDIFLVARIGHNYLNIRILVRQHFLILFHRPIFNHLVQVNINIYCLYL